MKPKQKHDLEKTVPTKRKIKPNKKLVKEKTLVVKKKIVSEKQKLVKKGGHVAPSKKRKDVVKWGKPSTDIGYRARGRTPGNGMKNYFTENGVTLTPIKPIEELRVHKKWYEFWKKL